MAEPLTGSQRRVFWAVAAVCAASRFLAYARSMWDWDEALFCLGMRHYDVTMHHPHPPGFPVYIGMGRVLRLVIGSDFRALQAINVIASLLVFPAIFLLARELGMRFQTSVIAGALFAFLPNVWFFGGTAFSDVPSIVLVVFAVVFLLRGRESRRDYWIGTLLLALAIGIRPQNLLVGLFPGILATLRRRWTEVVVALLIGVVVVGAAYGAAIHATGTFDAYMTTVRAHGDYIARIDSFRSSERPALWRIFDRFFFKQYQSPALSIVVTLFVFISIIGAIRRRDRFVLYNLLIFGPFAFSAWLMLDRYSINRFSIGYAPMFALFAADGIARASRGDRRIESGIAAIVIAAFIVWTAPALRDVRNEVSPPVKAVQTAISTIDPRRDKLFVGYSMTPFLEYLDPALPFTRVMDDRAVPLSAAAHPVLLAEISATQPEPFYFQRQRGRLWNIARRHYFEVVLHPLHNRAEFGDGWSAPESRGMDEWRWMSAHSYTKLPPAVGPTVLRLHFRVPLEILPQRPEITVSLNGKVLDRFAATDEYISRDYHVTPAANQAPNLMEMTTSRTSPGADNREMGLEVRFIAWGPN